MKTFGGEVLFLDRSDITTDEIIPAKYLTEIEREALRPYLFEDLKLDGFEPQRDLPGHQVIISRANFGCGSSREHAPWALEANGIRLVIAESFSRIFRQNMFNCGLLAVELPAATIERLFKECASPHRSDGGRRARHHRHPRRPFYRRNSIHAGRLRSSPGRSRGLAGIRG